MQMACYCITSIQGHMEFRQPLRLTSQVDVNAFTGMQSATKALMGLFGIYMYTFLHRGRAHFLQYLRQARLS